jgi:hypothetical protein
MATALLKEPKKVKKANDIVIPARRKTNRAQRKAGMIQLTDDWWVTPAGEAQLRADIDEARKAHEEGRTIVFSSIEELDAYISSL